MTRIVISDFNYYNLCRIISSSASTGADQSERIQPMKNLPIASVVIPGVIVATALLLSFRSPVNADTLVGLGTIFVLLAIVALEYRINWKRILGL